MNAAGETNRAAGPGDGRRAQLDFDVGLEAMRAPFPWAGTPATQPNGSKVAGQMQVQKDLRHAVGRSPAGGGPRSDSAMCYNGRLLDSGALGRVDRFQRDGKPYVRYRIPASGETFLLAAREDPPTEELVRVSRPHWHARSRLLYRSLSHLIAVERKLFTRDERNLEYLQTAVGEILRTILASARQVLECDETRLFAL